MRFGKLIVCALLLLFIMYLHSDLIKFNENCDNAAYSVEVKLQTESINKAAIQAYSHNSAHWFQVLGIMKCLLNDTIPNEANINDALGSLGCAIMFSDNTYEYLAKSDDGFICKVEPYAIDVTDDLTLLFSLTSDETSALAGNTFVKAFDIDHLKPMLGTYSNQLDVQKVKQNRSVYLAACINDAIEKAMSQSAMTSMQHMYIPAYDINDLGIKVIDGKALLCIETNNRDVSDNVMTLSGYTETNRDFIVGFVENGIKYYSKEDEAPDGYINTPGAKLFNNMYQADAEGYRPALHRLGTGNK